MLFRSRRHFGVEALWSHEETGNGWTYARDIRVGRWCRQNGIAWHEVPPFGVIRRLASRDGWAKRWEARMAEPLAPGPEVLQPLDGIEPGPIPDAETLGLAPDACPGRQRGGRSQGLTELESFLWVRGGRYHRELSSPLTAFQGCSRLSAHLAWGTLSLREVVQASRRRGRELRGLPAEQRGEWPRALRGFEERLHWHCHFIQKLEDQPDLEFRSLHPLSETWCPRSPAPGSPVAAVRGNGQGALPSPRPGEEAAEPNGAGSGLAPEAAARLAAWSEGRTGLPFVDACMRCLIATGWLNFRMRAMLLSVACHHLALPWREAGLEIGRAHV